MPLDARFPAQFAIHRKGGLDLCIGIESSNINIRLHIHFLYDIGDCLQILTLWAQIALYDMIHKFPAIPAQKSHTTYILAYPPSLFRRTGRFTIGHNRYYIILYRDRSIG